MQINKIKSRMTELGYTQQKLSDELNMSVQTLNAKFNGRSIFSLNEVISITKILELDNPIEIFFDDISQKCNEEH
ncbi:helix-turn-helix domain protein [Clostridium cellulovorans 743B]|uniref:Helix-turn-helix domain protein n=2 Tax=Clostridium cellulovorans TaxID=1493 RepID=D9SQ32_CLOC7|nr:helix-turn-helix domain protein [Clostridium cellulovorans 743B]